LKIRVFGVFDVHPSSGEAGIRTPLENPAKLALLDQGRVESGAPLISDPGLASLIDAWPRLAEAMKSGILAMVRTASE